MKTKKFSRFLCMLVSVTMVFAMLPAMGITASAAAPAISFDARNGKAIADVPISGGTISLPTPPTWKDYTFAGWYTGIDGTGAAFTNSGLTVNAKVYAKWTKGGKTVRTEALKLNSAETTVSTNPGDQGWTWANKTLTLDGFLLDHSGGNGEPKGEISLPNGAIVAVSGTNSVIGGFDVEGIQMQGEGITCTDREGSFTIQGTGTLSVVVDKNGILVLGKGNLTISGATVKSEVRSNIRSVGLGAGGTLTIKDGATVSANGSECAIISGTTGIIAAGATVTGANEPFTSGTTTILTKKSEAAFVTISFAPPPPPTPPTVNVSYDVVGGTGSGSRLESSVNTVVTDPATGITAADKAAGNTISLKLTVAEKTAAGTPDSDKIEGVKQGDNVQYYDVKVEKTVTPSGGNPTTTVLTSIPKSVQAIIPVPAAIQGKTSYTVYRIHNGVAEKIPNDPTAPEFYSANEGGTSLTLNVKNFSTYAVITGNKSLSGIGALGDATNPVNSAVDVQGKILEGVLGSYKLDVSWGGMRFDYNATGAVWNPDNHGYVPGSGTKGWTNESFEAGNNKITVANHSNGDVTLSYLAKPDAVLNGTAMTVRSTNSLAGIEAANLLLAKVPTEGGAVPTIDTYVWLTGEPTNLAGLNAKTYTKAGVITVTAEPDLTSGLTPKTSTP